jgi:DNA polymerase-3 subunit delta'
MRPELAAAAAWLTAEGVGDAALALAHTGNAPLRARELARADYWQRRQDLLTMLADEEFDALATAERVRDYDVDEVVGWLQKWTFDLLWQRHVSAVRFNPDFAQAVRALAARIDDRALLRYHRELVRFQRIVDHPLNARLLFERLFIDYAGAVAPTSSPASETV